MADSQFTVFLKSEEEVSRRALKFLVQLRNGKCPNAPFLISFFGGHSEVGESAVKTAVRESYEELRIRVEETDLREILRIEHPFERGSALTVLLYQIPIDWDQVRVEEGAGAAFYDIDELVRLSEMGWLTIATRAVVGWLATNWPS